MDSDLLQRGSTHQIEVRVEYNETDGQKRVHHANYLNYFERARVEMLRAGGVSYKQFEASGRMLVVTEMNIKYFAAAEFDDVLTVTTTLVDAKKVRLYHEYRIQRGDQLVVQATSTRSRVSMK
ncbi:acyl-CoA thioesterase, partial [Rhodopirellula maiorica SM1]